MELTDAAVKTYHTTDGLLLRGANATEIITAIKDSSPMTKELSLAAYVKQAVANLKRIGASAERAAEAGRCCQALGLRYARWPPGLGYIKVRTGKTVKWHPVLNLYHSGS